jgi:hypothetical protein
MARGVGAAPREVEQLRAAVERLSRSAGWLARQAEDLWSMGWEPAVIEVEKVAGGEIDRAPRAGDERARRLFKRALERVLRAEADMVGLERMTTALFVASTPSPEATWGSRVSNADFNAALKRQRRRAEAGEYTPVKLASQPLHPGRKK